MISYRIVGGWKKQSWTGFWNACCRFPKTLDCIAWPNILPVRGYKFVLSNMQPKCVDFKACWIIIENQYGTVGTRVDSKHDQSKSLDRIDDRILLQKKLSRGIVKSQRPRSKLDVE